MAKDRLEAVDFRPNPTEQDRLNVFRKISTLNFAAHHITGTFLDEVGVLHSTWVVHSWLRGENEFAYRIGGRVRRYPTAFLMIDGKSDNDRVSLKVLQVILSTRDNDLLSFDNAREVPGSITNPVMLTVVTDTNPILPGIYLDHGSRRWGLEGFDGWLSNSFIPDLIKRV